MKTPLSIHSSIHSSIQQKVSSKGGCPDAVCLRKQTSAWNRQPCRGHYSPIPGASLSCFFLFSPSRFRSSTLALSRLTDLLILELLSFPILSPSTFKLHGHFSFLQNCLVRRRMCKELGLWKKMERAKLVETSRLNRPGKVPRKEANKEL